MIRLGLCSASCITRDVKGVLDIAKAAKLDAIEWAQDVHIGLGELKAAEAVMIATLEAGLTTASYATLYRAGSEDEGHSRFEALLAVASLLQAPIMRIYACCERQADALAEQNDLVPELRHLGEESAKRGITLCLSMGRGTGFDSYERALNLVEAVGHDFVRLAWEDLPRARPKEATAALDRAGKLAQMVVARCAGPDGISRPTASETQAWRERLTAFKRSESNPKMGRFVLLGAARSGGEEGAASLAADSKTLRDIVDELEPPKRRR